MDELDHIRSPMPYYHTLRLFGYFWDSMDFFLCENVKTEASHQEI